MSLLTRLKNKVKNSKEIKNASWLIAGKVAQMALSFAIGILTTRYLGPSNFGSINYGTAFVTFFMSLCTLGLNAILVKEFVDNPSQQGVTLGTSLIMRGLSSVLSIVCIIGVVSIIDKGEPNTILVVSICSISLIFHIFDTFNYWFQYRYESKAVAITTLIAYFATSIYRIVLLSQNKDVFWFAFASSFDYIVYAVVIYSVYKRKGGPKLAFSLTKAKSLLGRSYHYIISGMMVAIYGQTDKLMLKQMLDETSVGYYSLATTVNLMWVFVLQAIIDSLTPTIMSLHKKGDKNAFDRKNKQLYFIVIYISIIVALLFVFFGRYAIVMLYGKEYEPAAEPLKIITWYTIFSYLGVARNAWIVCNNYQKYLKYMYLSAAIINIILNTIFIPILGASGAALASLITQVLTSMVLPCFIRDLRPNVKLMIDAFLLRDIK